MEAKHIMPMLQHLLQSNVVPREGEAELVRKVIIPQMVKKARDIKKHNYSGTLHKHIESQVQFYKSTADLWRTTLSAIRRFPAEILVEIFLWTMVHSNFELYYGRVTQRLVKDLPWALSQVCQHWRMTALCTPALWRRLPVLDLSLPTGRTVDRRMDIFEELVKRSNYTSLDVYILSLDGGHQNRNHPMLKFIMDYSDVWAHLKVRSSFATLHDMRAIRGHLPALKSVELVFEDAPSDLFVVQRLSMFSEAPALRSVQIKGEYAGRVILPISQLALIRDSTISVSRWINLHSVATFNNLVNLAIKEDEPTAPLPVLHFPRLTTLSLTTDIDADIGLLHTGIFPVLENIYVSPLEDIGDLYEAIRLLLHRSGCGESIVVIDLEEKVLLNPYQGLLDLLRLTPNLRTLAAHLPSREVLSIFANVYCRKHRKVRFLPDLQTCRFFVTQEIDDPDDVIDVLCDIADDRWPTKSRALWLIGYDPRRRWVLEYSRRVVRHQILEPVLSLNAGHNPFVWLAEQLHVDLWNARKACIVDPDKPINWCNVELDLSAIEDIPLADYDISKIMAADIHFDIADLLNSLVLRWKGSDGTQKMIDQIARILRNWRPLFMEVASKMRWTRMYPHWDPDPNVTAFVYVPEKARVMRDAKWLFVDTLMGLRDEPRRHLVIFPRN